EPRWKPTLDEARNKSLPDAFFDIVAGEQPFQPPTSLEKALRKRLGIRSVGHLADDAFQTAWVKALDPKTKSAPSPGTRFNCEPDEIDDNTEFSDFFKWLWSVAINCAITESVSATMLPATRKQKEAGQIPLDLALKLYQLCTLGREVVAKWSGSKHELL